MNMEADITGLAPKKAFIHIGAALIVQFVVTTLVSWAIYLPLNDPQKLHDFMVTVGPSATLGISYIPRVIGVLAFWLIVRKMPVFKKGGGLGFKNLIQIFLIMYAVSISLNTIGTTITAFSPAGKSMELESISSIVTTGNIVGIMIPVLFAPVLEELVFRKMILDRTKGYGETTAIVFSALSFGLFHQNLTQILFAFGVGLFLGYVYCKTGKVAITMIMHILINGFSSVLMFIMPMFGKGFNPALVIAVILLSNAIIAMLISGIVLLVKWLKNRRFILDNSMNNCIPRKDVLKTVYINPAVVSYIVICIAVSVLSFMNVQLFN